MFSIKDKKNKLVIHNEPALRIIGIVFMDLSVLLSVLFIVLGMIVWDFFLMLNLFTAVLFLIGFIVLILNGKTVMDVEERKIKIKKVGYSFYDFSKVSLFSDTEIVPTGKGGTTAQLRFFIGLYRKKGEDKMESLINDLNSFMEKTGEKEIEKYTEEQKKQFQDILLKLYEAVEENTMILTSCLSELAAWKVAEKAAKTLGIPLLDLCGEIPLYRKPEELDMPLKERLLSHYDEVAEPGEKPSGVTLNEEYDSMTFQWEGNNKDSLFSIHLLIGIFLSIGLLITLLTADFIGLIIMLFPSVLVACFYPSALKGHGINKLIVTKKDIIIRLANQWIKSKPVPLDSIESLRVNTQLDPSLNVIGDKKRIKLSMPVEQGLWIAQKIEYFLVS